MSQKHRPPGLGSRGPRFGGVVCETQLGNLQIQFNDAYTKLTEMKELKMVEKDSTQCDALAESELNAEVVPLTTQREHVTDKVEESEEATAALEPVIQMMNDQLGQLKGHVAHLKQECTDAVELQQHLKAVAKLITTTIDCPGIAELSLATPTDVCHTNGITCSWKCSDEGSIFQVGGFYGRYVSILNVPKDTELEGRAYCEKQCVKDVHCVGFTHVVNFGECHLKLDVLHEFDTNGLDKDCQEWEEGAGGTVTDEEPELSETPVLTQVDSCGCPTGTGWCSEHQECEAGGTTELFEAECCGETKIPTRVLAGNGTSVSCYDGCSCAPGQGWSTEEGACVKSSHAPFSGFALKHTTWP